MLQNKSVEKRAKIWNIKLMQQKLTFLELKIVETQRKTFIFKKQKLFF